MTQAGPMIVVRDAVESDLPAILDIVNHAILHTTALWTIRPTTLEARTAWWKERVESGFPVLVADAGEPVAAFASYGPFRPHDGYFYTVEHSIYVATAAQGRGIGRALLAALIERAIGQGKHVMIGGIEAGNAASLRLHAAFGFVETGRLPRVGRKFDRWMDLVFMQKALGGPDPV
jgi:phosphinothricin acetyltransferase